MEYLSFMAGALTVEAIVLGVLVGIRWRDQMKYRRGYEEGYEDGQRTAQWEAEERKRADDEASALFFS